MLAEHDLHGVYQRAVALHIRGCEKVSLLGGGDAILCSLSRVHFENVLEEEDDSVLKCRYLFVSVHC